MTTLLLETWKVKSIKYESDHEENMIKTLVHVNQVAKNKGIRIPRHR